MDLAVTTLKTIFFFNVKNVTYIKILIPKQACLILIKQEHFVKNFGTEI